VGYENTESEQEYAADEVSAPAAGVAGKGEGADDLYDPFDRHPGNDDEGEDEEGKNGVEEQEAAEAEVCDALGDAPVPFPDVTVEDGEDQEQEAIQQEGEARVADDDEVGE